MFPPSRKSNVENEGKFDFGNSSLKIENVISILTPFNAQVTEIDVHREEISYIVSEEFFEQFTALAFINFKKISPNNYPACRVCHEEDDFLRKL